MPKSPEGLNINSEKQTKMKSELDFSKAEDQKNFDNLSKDEQNKIIDKAWKEADEIRKMAKIIASNKWVSGENYQQAGLEFNKKQRKETERLLKKIGIERDPQGRLIFYHATPAKCFAKILKAEEILPPILTNEITWSQQHEMETEKAHKVYLATKKSIEAIARRIQNRIGGSIYILEVHVDENYLFPDEDTKQDSWKKSLITSADKTTFDNTLGRCSHWGGIDNFKIYKKLDYALPLDKLIDYEEQYGDDFYYIADQEVEKGKKEEEKMFSKKTK